MKLLRNILLSIGIFSLLCSCSTTYQKSGFTGGHSETQLDENVFKVTFKGNGRTSKEKASDFSLLRSAEITLEHGFSYFVIVDADDYTSHHTYTTPTRTNTSINIYGSGNNTYGTAYSTSSGGQTYNIKKPSTTNVFYCLKKKPKGIFSYNANFIYDSLTTKYKIAKKY